MVSSRVGGVLLRASNRLLGRCGGEATELARCRLSNGLSRCAFGRGSVAGASVAASLGSWRRACCGVAGASARRACCGVAGASASVARRYEWMRDSHVVLCWLWVGGL